ncbi:MAG: response regulator [Myxococcota bacterium]
MDALIVEDDTDLREILHDLLELGGLRVEMARDGDEAWAYLLASLPPRAILLDWFMPRLDGASFRERQRAHIHLRKVPTIVVTGAHHVLREVDADAVLVKPFSEADLWAVLARVGVRA